ncbi:MAG: PH domain-containing protein [Candidatus Mcinerneyibacterium aminivorans]|uniref:PH domain-containing protein n=1 Tax=Candidatus Mcinerneyibacterium aminivorans TaxID=2703815 RepID=A0A5D0MKF8_9BACT|nr:MAG: PH domain-containing protein [Candidatus Mcinerneyibacterium aminivorans]
MLYYIVNTNNFESGGFKIKIKNKLRKNEKIIFRTDLNYAVFNYPVFFFLVSLISLLLLIDIAVYIFLCISIVSGVYCFIKYKNSLLIITNQRVICYSKNFFHDKILQTSLDKIEDIEVKQGLIGKIFGCAKIEISNTDGIKRTYKRISAPFQFNRILQEQILASDYLNIFDE